MIPVFAEHVSQIVTCADPITGKDIDRKKADGSYELTEAERKEKKRLRQAMAMHT